MKAQTPRVLDRHEVQGIGDYAAFRELLEDGIALLIHKPAGLTSFDVVYRARRWSGIRKMGHAGTLDPAAAGLLILLTAKATKWQQKFMQMEKDYLATILLGVATETWDLNGEVTERKKVPEVSREEIAGLLDGHFSGEIEQVPPAYSALKRGGIPGYKRARRGEQVLMPPRKVTIYAIELVDYVSPEVTLKLRCSSGFYVRSLAHDIGRLIGCGAALKSLLRTQIGPYHLEDAVTLDELTEWLNQHKHGGELSKSKGASSWRGASNPKGRLAP